MPSNESSPPEGKRGRAGRSKPSQPIEEVTTPSGVKVLAAFRIPKPLHNAMQQEARAEGLDLTAYVNRLFEGFLHHFGLPSVVEEMLERDREALKLTRHNYLQYVLYRRHEAVGRDGPAFDRQPPKHK